MLALSSKLPSRANTSMATRKRDCERIQCVATEVRRIGME
jgi:hypothetical protein